MATDCTFNRVDTAPIQDTNFSPEFLSWLSTTVDTINEDLNILEECIQQLDARITASGG